MMIEYLILFWLILFFAELFFQKLKFNPARVLGLAMFLLSQTLIPLWDFSKFYPGSGITTYLEFPRSDAFQASLLITALAMQLTSLLFWVKFSGVQFKLASALSNLKIPANLLSGSLLILWGIGQGSSLLLRNGYLQSNGELLLLRPLAFLAPLLAVFLYLAAILEDRAKNAIPHVIAGIWFSLLLAIGSRSSLLFLLLFFGLLFRNTFKSKIPAFKALFLVTQTYLGVYCFLLVFSATLYARLNQHGVLRLFQMLSHNGSPGIIPNESWVETWSSLAISISSSYPIISISIYSVVPASLLLINSNPLPTEFLGIAPNNAAEFILPWLPKALIGELYGAVGPTGQFFTLLFMGLLAMYFYGRSLLRGDYFLALAIGVIFMAAMFLSLQYPSRVVFRIYSITYLLPALVWIWRASTSRRKRFSRESDDRKGISRRLSQIP